MNILRVLYHLARADFLERTRRYGFLIILGLVLWLGYISASRQMQMRITPDYLGEFNSAWVGALMTITVTTFLGMFGFYFVKGSVSRDYETGVGQIMATTPLTRPLYMLGKWLSNFAVLGILILILMLVGILLNLWVGMPGFDLWMLIAPLLFVALPCMALIASLAVLFESIGWLRAGLGNVVYFFIFIILFSSSALGAAYVSQLDFFGWALIGNSIKAAALAAYPESSGGVFSFVSNTFKNPKYFLWNGIDWNMEVILPRLLLIAIAIGIALLAAVFFDRFNPSHALPAKGKRTGPNHPGPATVPQAMPVSSVHLTPLTHARSHFRFDALFAAELKLFLKGQRWWWYAIALGLIVAQLFSALEVTRFLLVISWAWPVLILGALGCRETRYDTRQIVFSAPRPLMNQLPAAWLSAFAVLALMGSGALVRFILAGESVSLFGWMTGVLFIPSLALACGVLTGSSKTFEVIHVLWMYILIQKAPLFDFIGMTPASPWAIYALLASVLLIIATFARHRQLTARSVSR